MSLHRDLVRGTGFYDTLVGKVPSVDEIAADLEGLSLESSSSLARSLPIVNLLGTDQDRIKALMQEALPQDRARFQTYLSERPLGLGVITAGAGFGKTTALAVGTIGMACHLGKIYATGPTHVAVDNFAARLDRVDTSVTDRMNEGKKDDDETRVRYKHVVRGYKLDDEAYAFLRLLRFPDDGDKAAPSSLWSGQSKWKMHLSAAYWLLVLLRFPKVRELRLDDSVALHKMRSRIDNDEQLERLRALATQEIDWNEYERGTMLSRNRLESLLEDVICDADIVCTTPSLSDKVPYSAWKHCRAQGIAVDEAACISRPDLYCVWGNTLLPCLMAGDDKQLPPTVMTLQEKDAAGNFLNRLGQHAKISPLLFFKTMGWPVYRLRTQLRMARGMFELCHAEVYSDLPFQYGPGCDVSLPQHSAGRQLEVYLQKKYSDLKPAAAGTLQPAFVHCAGSFCYIDPVTQSKSNMGQNRVALALLSDFVKESKVDPACFVVISPYKSNVELINRLRKNPEYAALAGMADAVTVDSFQGQEGDIAVVVMGTTGKSGPGFTADEQRLNVMFSRQKNGLLVVGDIDAAGPLGKDKKKKKGKGTQMVTFGANGEAMYVRGDALRNMYKALMDSGRVVKVEAKPRKESVEVEGK
ncbi:hypothetical protein NW759_016004 [Fusarium solani]|nr:hypothetical protein NW759_016004 [Fusarium solani]